MKKYEFTGETWRLGNVMLHRIKAVRDFGDVEVGDLGGWIEQEENLSHEGNCWISGNAKVYDNAKVSGNAKVYKPTDLLTIGPIGSRVDTTTFYRVKSGVINVVCGCFSGSIDDFAAAVEKTHGNDRHGRDYRLAIELAKSRILGEEK